MINKSLLIALGLSLLFNIFVLVGFVRARAIHGPLRNPDQMRRPEGQPRFDNRMARELNLNEEQSKMLAKLQQDQRERGQVFDQSITLLRQSLNEELRKENPDIERVRELVNEEADMFRQRRLSEANLFGVFMEQLTPEQRREVMKRMGRGGQQPQQPIPPKILEKFDLNRNGHLEPDEMREARKDMERRRREFPDQPRGQRPPRPDSGDPNRPMHEGSGPHRPAPNGPRTDDGVLLDGDQPPMPPPPLSLMWFN